MDTTTTGAHNSLYYPAQIKAATQGTRKKIVVLIEVNYNAILRGRQQVIFQHQKVCSREHALHQLCCVLSLRPQCSLQQKKPFT